MVEINVIGQVRACALYLIVNESPATAEVMWTRTGFFFSLLLSRIFSLLSEGGLLNIVHASCSSSR